MHVDQPIGWHGGRISTRTTNKNYQRPYLMNTGFPWTCKFIRNDAILVGTKPCALWVSILTPPSYDFT